MRPTGFLIFLSGSSWGKWERGFLHHSLLLCETLAFLCCLFRQNGLSDQRRAEVCAPAPGDVVSLSNMCLHTGLPALRNATSTYSQSGLRSLMLSCLSHGGSRGPNRLSE